MMDIINSRPCVSRGGSDVSATTATSNTSVGSSVDQPQPSRSLLFGEIPSTPTTQSSFSNSSVCNLVLSSSSAFLRFWLSEDCRNALLRNVDRNTLPALRLVCHNFASTAAPFLFKEIGISFKASTFKPSRLYSLRRVGRHVKKLTFNVPHSADCFLPPLLDPCTGEQLSFNYVPQVDTPEKSNEPKYGTWEMTDVLIRQYPPLFHAATNIPTFIRAFSTMPNVEHVTIFSPDQNMSPRYRRSVADYTLVSIRIALERAPLPLLNSLALKSIHPNALLYLLPVLSYGSTPNSCRRWTQITNLTVEMDSTPFEYPRTEDLIRVVQSYLRSFSTSLISLSFRYTGRSKGPSPLSPASNNHSAAPFCYTLPPVPPKDSHVHPLARPRPMSPTKPLRFFRLKYLTLESATMDSASVSSFITLHRDGLIEFCFEDVTLRNGDWASTLEPLRKLKRSKNGSFKVPPAVTTAFVPHETDFMDVPCKLSPLDMPEDEPIIMDTLEPQEGDAPWLGATKRSKGMRKWLGLSAPKQAPAYGHERKVSDHLRRVFGGSVWTWR